jgi:hypothetical protein
MTESASFVLVVRRPWYQSLGCGAIGGETDLTLWRPYSTTRRRAGASTRASVSWPWLTSRIPGLARRARPHDLHVGVDRVFGGVERVLFGYVALFGLSLFALISGFAGIGKDRVYREIHGRVSPVVYSGFL